MLDVTGAEKSFCPMPDLRTDSSAGRAHYRAMAEAMCAPRRCFARTLVNSAPNSTICAA